MTAPTLIVGAGPGGLAVARAFKLFGVPYVHVERHTEVGGIWDADNPGSPIYESAHFISSKTCSAFHGMPMPDDYPDYPGRAQILEYLFPKHLFGHPVDAFLQQGPHLPNWLAQPILAGLLRLVIGRQDRFGLRAPDHRPLESHPVLNTQVFHYLSHGDLVMKPDVSRFDDDMVHFTDGTSERFDTVLCATGFRHEVPFLPPATIPTTRSGRPTLITGTFVPGRTDLFVPGMFETNSGGYMLYDKLAFLVAQTVRDLDDTAQGSRVRAAIQEDVDLSGGLRFVDSPRTEDYVDATALARRIETVAGKLG
jgi:hypothetical protein